MIVQAIFIGSIATYVNFLMPEYTIGTDVAALITEEYAKPACICENYLARRSGNSTTRRAGSKEYFARYVSYWVAYPSLRLELEEYAPNTAKLTKKLIENYDTLLALYDEVP